MAWSTSFNSRLLIFIGLVLFSVVLTRAQEVGRTECQFVSHSVRKDGIDVKIRISAQDFQRLGMTKSDLSCFSNQLDDRIRRSAIELRLKPDAFLRNIRKVTLSVFIQNVEGKPQLLVSPMIEFGPRIGCATSEFPERWGNLDGLWELLINSQGWMKVVI